MRVPVLLVLMGAVVLAGGRPVCAQDRDDQGGTYRSQYGTNDDRYDHDDDFDREGAYLGGGFTGAISAQ